MHLPSVDDVNQTRLARFDDAITTALADTSKVEFFREVVAHYVREHDVPEVDVAAALAVVLQGGEPLLLEPEPERPPGGTALSGAIVKTAAVMIAALAPRSAAGMTAQAWLRTSSASGSATAWSRARSSARSPTRAAWCMPISGRSRSVRTSRSSSSPPISHARCGMRSPRRASQGNSSSCAATRVRAEDGSTAARARVRAASAQPEARQARRDY